MRRTAAIMRPLVFAAAAIVSPPAGAEDGASQPVSFIRAVAPILVARCQACHGPKTAESNYRLDSFESLMQPGDFGTPPVTPRDLDNSELHRLITAEDAEERMPNNGGRLADSEIQTVAHWILQGAGFDGQSPSAPLRDQIPRDIPHPAAPETYPAALPVTAMAFATDGKRLVVGGYHELVIWAAESGTLVERVGNIAERTFGMAIRPDGRWLAVAGGSPGVSGEVRLIPWQDGPKNDAPPKVLATSDDVFFDVACRPDGQQLAAAAADGSVRVFDVETGAERLKIDNHAGWVSDVCYSPDGRHIATASRDHSAKVFDAETGALLTTHSDHNAPVRAVAFSPDGKLVLSAGANRIDIWAVDDPKTVGELTGFGNDVYALLAGGESVVAAAADGTARHFKLSDRTLIRTMTEHPAWVLSFAWHDPSQHLATGCFDGTVTIWNLENGAMMKRFSAFPIKDAPKERR